MPPFGFGWFKSALQRPFTGSDATYNHNQVDQPHSFQSQQQDFHTVHPQVNQLQSYQPQQQDFNTIQHQVNQAQSYQPELQTFHSSPTPPQHEQQFYDAKPHVSSHASPHAGGHHFESLAPVHQQSYEQRYHAGFDPRAGGQQPFQSNLSPQHIFQQHFPASVTSQHDIQQYLNSPLTTQLGNEQCFPSNVPPHQGLRHQFSHNAPQQSFQPNFSHIASQQSSQSNLQSGLLPQQTNSQSLVHQAAPQDAGEPFNQHAFQRYSPFQAHTQLPHSQFPKKHVGQPLYQQHFQSRQLQQQVQQQIQRDTEQQLRHQVATKNAPSARSLQDTPVQYRYGGWLHGNVEHGSNRMSQHQQHNVPSTVSMNTSQGHTVKMHSQENQARDSAFGHLSDFPPNNVNVQHAMNAYQPDTARSAEDQPAEDQHARDDKEMDNKDNTDHVSGVQQSPPTSRGVQQTQGEEMDLEREDEEFNDEDSRDDQETVHEDDDLEMQHEDVDLEMQHEGVDLEMQHEGIDVETGSGHPAKQPGHEDFDQEMGSTASGLRKGNEASGQETGHQSAVQHLDHEGAHQQMRHEATDSELEHDDHDHDQEMEDASASDAESDTSDEEEQSDDEDSSSSADGPQFVTATHQSKASPAQSIPRSKTPVTYNITDTTSLIPTIRGPDPIKDLNKHFLAFEKFHLKAFTFKPSLPLASHRYWIAVLHLDKQPKAAAMEKHFLWMKGNRLTTIETVWRTYQMTSMAEDFVLLHGFEGVQFKHTMQELDLFGDKFVCLRAVSKAKCESVAKGYFEDVVPKSFANEVVEIN